MKCPACHSPTISFSVWSRGLNWLRWRCPHCGTHLKASKRTIGLLILCLALIPICICFLSMISDTARIEAIWFCPLLFVAIMVPSTIGIGYYAWKTDCYVHNPDPGPTRVD